MQWFSRARLNHRAPLASQSHKYTAMMKRILLLSLLALSAVAAMAQGARITGYLVDRDTKDAAIQVTVQLLRPDSTYVDGTLSDNHGNFSIPAPGDGQYLLKFSSVGYKNLVRKVKVAGGKDVDLGKVTLNGDAIMLKEATVLGQAARVAVTEDTFVYNAAAYRTPEGSVVEELVKKLPGVQVDDEGNIKVNGKDVKKILVDGKEFMTGDTKTAMKNLPTSIIEKVKAYDEKSDLAKITGIDDGEEETVLDFGIKKGMNKGFLGNADLSLGTRSRYSEKVMAGLFRDKTKVMVVGNANNTNDQGFPGGGGGGGRGGGAGQGLNAAKMVGANINYDSGGKLAMDASLRWNHSDGDVRQEQSTENFVSQSGSFSNSLGQTYNRQDSWDARLRLEWKPDSMTDIMFRPNLTYSRSDSRETSSSGSYSDDPYLYVDDPLLQDAIATMARDSVMVNTRSNTSVSYTEKTSFNAMLQLNRKFGSKGRNATLRADVSYGQDDGKSLTTSDVHLFQVLNALGTDSTYQTNRYSYTPTRNWSYSVQGTYSEPIFKAMFLQFSYKFTYKYSKSDRSTYDFSDIGEGFFDGVDPAYRGWDNYLSLLPGPLEDYLDDDLSRFSEYRNYIHDIQVMLRVIRPKYTLNVGALLQPQKTRFVQRYQGVSTDTVRNVVNFSPTLDFRYRFSKISNLRLNYRGTTTQPSMSDLLDITDDSDPLNVTMGNPGLKPSFTNSFRLFYNNFIQNHQKTVMTFVNFSNTRNSISNMVTYDDATGGRTTRPENINGNWDIRGALMFNTALDTLARWNVSTFTNVSYNNYVGYLALDDGSGSEKNTTRTTTVSEQLSGSFRNSWFEVTLDGSLSYTHTRNLLQSQNNLDTWQFSYGPSLNFYMPWGMSLSTDFHANCRRGYNDSSMNTNELLWNAQLSQGFLKGKALTVSVQFYDILHQQSNFSRMISDMQRSDTKYNNINSYGMVHVVYRLNVFGGRDARRGPGPDGREGPPDGMRPPMGEGGPGGPGGRPPGGFGGGRPGGGPGGGRF